MTSYLTPITELRLHGVRNAGVANSEVIVLEAVIAVDIGQYAIVLARRAERTGMAMPLPDAMFWFNTTVIPTGDFMLLWTGAGRPHSALTGDGKATLHQFFWNRAQTIFHDSNIVPMLWRLGGVVVESSDTIPAVLHRYARAGN
ncbi:MAG TPA: hypothetical protein VNZ26_35685 [Vicinamibacterales bacterium]|jgi:hypothetical protein|nr:hypothetical protein [Vicinamibacterales bacterium]